MFSSFKAGVVTAALLSTQVPCAHALDLGPGSSGGGDSILTQSSAKEVRYQLGVLHQSHFSNGTVVKYLREQMLWMSVDEEFVHDPELKQVLRAFTQGGIADPLDSLDPISMPTLRNMKNT